MMDRYNTIDVQQLEITPQDADNTYLGIDENGQLIRTKIELSSGGGESDLSNYYTKSEVDKKIDNIDIPSVDLSDYYTKNEIDDIVDGIDIPSVDLDDYYTKNEVDKKLDEIVIGGTDINLSNYYTKQEVDDIVDEIDLTPFVTEDELNAKGYLTEHQDISGKQDIITDLAEIKRGAALGKTALQSVPAEYITESELETRLENIGGEVDLDNYYTKTEIDIKLDELVIGEKDVDLSNYYTKQEVDEIVDDIDLTGYATEQWVRRQGYVTDSDVNDYVGNEIGQLEEVIKTKQDKITDLDTIRSGAAAGATALQTIPSEYITENDLSEYYTKTEIDDMIGDINNILESI